MSIYNKLVHFIDNDTPANVETTFVSNFLGLEIDEDIPEDDINWLGLNLRVLRNKLTSQQITTLILKFINKVPQHKVKDYFQRMNTSDLELTEEEHSIILITKNTKHFGNINNYMTDFLKKDENGKNIVDHHISRFVPLYGLISILKIVYESKMNELSFENQQLVLHALDRIRIYLESPAASAFTSKKKSPKKKSPKKKTIFKR